MSINMNTKKRITEPSEMFEIEIHRFIKGKPRNTKHNQWVSIRRLLLHHIDTD